MLKVKTDCYNNQRIINISLDKFKTYKRTNENRVQLKYGSIHIMDFNKEDTEKIINKIHELVNLGFSLEDLKTKLKENYNN